MKLTLEQKSLGWALSAALFSVGSAWVLAGLIKIMAISTRAPSDEASSEIHVSPELASQGHEFYEMSCSHCHGDDAHGDEGPDLHNLAISNARIAMTIKKGVKGEMPTFAKKYDDAQISSLVSYLRSLK
jgi:mono/diheme cytochrome c family protein